MHNVPEKVEEDYRMLISAKQLSQGKKELKRKLNK